jgi:hypothetical protein
VRCKQRKCGGKNGFAPPTLTAAPQSAWPIGTLRATMPQCQRRSRSPWSRLSQKPSSVCGASGSSSRPTNVESGYANGAGRSGDGLGGIFPACRFPAQRSVVVQCPPYLNLRFVEGELLRRLFSLYGSLAHRCPQPASCRRRCAVCKIFCLALFP